MSVDYYVCSHCGETFPDCGYYVHCECGEKWCSDECAEADGFVREEWEEDDGSGTREYEEISCKYCRNEDYYDSELLAVALNLLHLNREDLIKMVKEERI